MKKKFYKRILAFIISFVLSVNMPLCGYMSSYADGIASYDPALIPIYALVTSIAVATGIVARNVTDAGNQLISNAISQIKYNEVLKATSDNTYNSPYRVIGSNGQPEKPNNNNKNGKWFALGAASSLGAAVAFEKGAVKDIADTLNNLGAYSPMQGSLGIISANAFKTQSTASAIALQLANISNSAVTQFDQFLHSSWWDNKDFTPDDCWFSCNVKVTDILRQTPSYPNIYVNIYKKNDNLQFVDLTNCFGYYTYTNSYGSLSYYYANTKDPVMTLLNNDQVAINTQAYYQVIYSRTADQNLSFSNSTYQNTSRLKIFGGTNLFSEFAYCGYKWQQETPWQYTNNVYNAGDTIINQFPNWDQSSINLLGEQIDALRIGIQNLNNPWNATQDQIQQGLSPEEVIAQLINNYLNPENAPDPEPNPNPDPDPDPNPDPDPKPYPEPITFPQLEEAGQSIYDWVTTKITLPDGIFDKIPFSIPYDLYLLFRSMFPTNNRRTFLRVANNDAVVQNPSHITISSTFEAAGKSTRTYSENTWEKTAPVINLDLHFKYHDVSGTEKQIDIVKTVDLKPYSYFAMILYIMIYITWIFNILGWISSSFH